MSYLVASENILVTCFDRGNNTDWSSCDEDSHSISQCWQTYVKFHLWMPCKIGIPISISFHCSDTLWCKGTKFSFYYLDNEWSEINHFLLLNYPCLTNIICNSIFFSSSQPLLFIKFLWIWNLLKSSYVVKKIIR